ncbi:MAG: ferredoxin--NADP reductase [Candidatus Limnocylindrales bacterium]|jgi:ferredoxin--NADP+ reductase
MAAEYNATVTGRVEVAPGLISLRVTPDEFPFEFKPGQYLVLGLKASEPRIEEADADGPSVVDGEGPPGPPESRAAVDAQVAAAARAAADPDRMIRRAFCIASDRRAEEYLEFYVTLILSGELTPRLFNLKAGDRLHVGPKAEGVFTLDPASSKHILMIATGTGLAPYMSMIRNELELRVDGRIGLRAVWQCNGPRHFVMVHGARYSWDLGYRTELTGLARHCANFHYLPVITRPQEDTTWSGRSGHIQDVVASGVVEHESGLALTRENFDVFLCGNPGMIETMITWAESRGFVRDSGRNVGNLHFEKYW